MTPCTARLGQTGEPGRCRRSAGLFGANLLPIRLLADRRVAGPTIDTAVVLATAKTTALARALARQGVELSLAAHGAQCGRLEERR